ncbi:MAG TPA: patatin-like phospholipase family protein [Polyangiaceae bacterium LLY-WYZ-14_1]|jgi:NTE family protein|nr:patatin-like phospholipase family protein [Polyangiaceae bacterium LLY-WYZ-14_1]
MGDRLPGQGDRPRVALIGSGGATKGIAHLGVLKALEEIDVDADIVIGASTGAICGAFYVQGYSADQLVDWLRPFWRRQDKSGLRGDHFLGLPNLEQLRRPGYLGSGLFSIDAFERFLRRKLPVNDFRRLDKTLLVTATDVDGRGRVVFGKGYEEDVPISEAVAASSCIPLLFRPYRIGDRYYVDGEIVRTLSIDLAVDAGADVVIISNVYRPHVTRHGESSLALAGASRVLRQSLNIVLSEKEKRGIDLIHRLYPHVTVLNVSADLGRFPFTNRLPARQLLTRGYREALRVLASAKQRGVFEVPSGVRAVGEA